MKVIPETSREHGIGYLRFYICISRILHLHMYISYLASTHVYLVSCFYTLLNTCLVARFYICIYRILHLHMYISHLASTHVYLVSCIYTPLNTCLVARFYICISCIYTCISRILHLHTLKHMLGGTFLYMYILHLHMYISYLASTHS